MAIGTAVRHRLGVLERPISGLYRSCFVSIPRFAREIAGAVTATRVLEVGCGEGALIQELCGALPEAEILGIDVTPHVGRLFRGDMAKVSFRQQTVAKLAAEQPGSFDLVVLCDVLHHVPSREHADLMAAAKATLRSGGVLVLKDWERRRTPIHYLAYIADRWVTGDRVRYLSAGDLRRLVRSTFGAESIVRETTIPPWTNNLALFAVAR